MSTPPLPPPPPPPPPPSPLSPPSGSSKHKKKMRGRGQRNNSQALVSIPKSYPSRPESFIPTPLVSGYQPYLGACSHMVIVGPYNSPNFMPPQPQNSIPTPPVSESQPYFGARARTVEVGPYKGYGHSPNFMPPQPQVALNELVGNRNVMQGPARRGTGVFLPAPQPRLQPNNKPSNSIGARNRLAAKVTQQAERRESTSEVNGGLVKEDESDERALCSKLGLPLEWTY